MAAATATGVLLGIRFGVAAAWVVAAFCLAVACLGAGRSRDSETRASAVLSWPECWFSAPCWLPAGRQPPCGRRRSAAASSSAGPASLRESRSPRTVAEEPHQVRYGGQWVVLTVNEVHRSGRTYRTRERAGMIVSRGRLPPSQPSQGGVEGRLAVGERLGVRASVGEARWSDSLGRQPPVVLRNPIIEGRAPPGGAALRISERVRDAARSRALASLTPERAGLLVGMALGDTSLLPAELERDFRAAGLTHLMAVSGANLAVVLAAGSGWPGLPAWAVEDWPWWGSSWWWCWSSSPGGSRACSGPG